MIHATATGVVLPNRKQFLGGDGAERVLVFIKCKSTKGAYVVVRASALSDSEVGRTMRSWLEGDRVILQGELVVRRFNEEGIIKKSLTLHVLSASKPVLLGPISNTEAEE